jgi:hypothetical protein
MAFFPPHFHEVQMGRCLSAAKAEGFFIAPFPP